MKKVLALMLCTLLALGALAGCGDAAGTSGGSSAAPATSDVGGSGGNLAAIKESGQLVMITNATFPPFEYKSQGGVDGVTGVDVELAQLVADEIGVKLVVRDMNFDLLIPSLQGGKGDIAVAGMSITDERKEAVDFSELYVDTTLRILVRPGSDITSVDDLNDKVVAVQESTTSHIFLQDSEDVSPKEISAFKSAVDAGAAVINGKADAAVIDELTGQNIINSNEGKLEMLDVEVSKDQYAMAVAKGNEDLLEVINKVLTKAVEDGVVEELIAKHHELTKE